MNEYSFARYVHYGRWASYWHQIDAVLKSAPRRVLIVGKGDGIVAEILKRHVGEVRTLDIESSLQPDIVASVEAMPLESGSFDAVLCCEVLEHLPFEKFEAALAELARVARRHVVVSLPHFGPPVKFALKLPFFREIRIAFKLPVPLHHVFNGEHYWEIGKRGYPPAKIRHELQRFFFIQEEFVPFDNQYHHFFILEKRPPLV